MHRKDQLIIVLSFLVIAIALSSNIILAKNRSDFQRDRAMIMPTTSEISQMPPMTRSNELTCGDCVGNGDTSMICIDASGPKAFCATSQADIMSRKKEKKITCYTCKTTATNRITIHIVHTVMGPSLMPMPSSSVSMSPMPSGMTGSMAIYDSASMNGNNPMMMDMAFNPNEITIPVGTKVTWVNDDKGMPHDSTADSKTALEYWDSGVLHYKETFSKTFTIAGDYPYHCDIHPYMKGIIHVVDTSISGMPMPSSSVPMSPMPSSSTSMSPMPSGMGM